MGTATSYARQYEIDPEASLRREGLVLEHMPQVRLIAGRIHDRLPDTVSLEDLVSSGVIGLLSAIDNFDPSRNTKLNTYAEHKIRGAIIDSLRQMDWAPRDVRRRCKSIEPAIARAAQRLGREPSEEEVAAELNIPLEEYHRWLAESGSLEIQRLEHVSSQGEGFDLLSIIGDDEETWPERLVARRELETLLAGALDRMPVRERTVIALYYYEELTLREIGEVMDIHLSRVAQLRTQAVLRLRSFLSRVKPRTFAGEREKAV
jgi:RNA polymerase sigma factor for flagellar operon FliA